MIFFLLLAVLLLGVMSVSYIRTYSTMLFPVHSEDVSPEDKNLWLAAVKAGDEKKALLYAERIVAGARPEFPDPDYIQLFYRNGFGTLALTSSFGHFDFIRWRDAWEVSRITARETAVNPEPIGRLFELVMSKQKPDATEATMSLYEMFRIKISRMRSRPYLSVSEIWEEGYASLDELFRLLASFAYQSGYDVQIVALYDKNLNLKHVVCEVRRGVHSYVCDPVYRRVWSDMSVERLAEYPEKLKGIWDVETIESLQRRVYCLPAEVMDYRALNQRLYRNLVSGADAGRIPRFGSNPRLRIDRYIGTYLKKMEKSRFSYWNFPFKSLMSCAAVPAGWRLPGLRYGSTVNKGKDTENGKDSTVTGDSQCRTEK